jgi:DNA adenine methylase
MEIKPIIKWVGGKTQIIDKIIDRFPREINNYHEFFLGGGSVLIALLESNKLNKIKVNGSINAYDINKTLISMYINIRDRPLELYYYIKKLKYHFNKIIITGNSSINGGSRKPKHINEITSKESFYYWTRYKFNKLKDKTTFRGSALFIFLNKTCFRGLYREGPNGLNAAYGNYNNPEILNKKHLFYISNLIKNVNFYHMDFEQSFYHRLNYNNELDFIYLDPPYAPINSTSFVNYTSDGFNIDRHKLLFRLTKELNCKFIMSNADTEFVRQEFNNYKIITILCKRVINSKNPESKANEVLIVN